jgi:hypothetical protein
MLVFRFSSLFLTKFSSDALSRCRMSDVGWPKMLRFGEQLAQVEIIHGIADHQFSGFERIRCLVLRTLKGSDVLRLLSAGRAVPEQGITIIAVTSSRSWFQLVIRRACAEPALNIKLSVCANSSTCLLKAVRSPSSSSVHSVSQNVCCTPWLKPHSMGSSSIGRLSAMRSTRWASGLPAV